MLSYASSTQSKNDNHNQRKKQPKMKLRTSTCLTRLTTTALRLGSHLTRGSCLAHSANKRNAQNVSSCALLDLCKTKCARTSRFVHKFLGTSSCELDHALGTVTMHVRECLHLMRTSDTAHQSYDNDVGQSARQQSHADHTGRDPRTAHDGHGQSMAATNVRNGCKRGTGCHCEDSCKLSTCSKFEAYLAWNLLTGVDAPYNQMRTSALVTSRDTGETQDKECWSTKPCELFAIWCKLKRRAYKPAA